MTTESGSLQKRMTLTYASHCGNPKCERGSLPPGSEVIVFERRIYCGPECISDYAAAPRRTGRRTTRTAASAAPDAS